MFFIYVYSKFQILPHLPYEHMVNQMSQNRILVKKIVNQTSDRTPMFNVLIMGTKWVPDCEVVRRYFSWCCGLRNPANSSKYGNNDSLIYNLAELRLCRSRASRPMLPKILKKHQQSLHKRFVNIAGRRSHRIRFLNYKNCSYFPLVSWFGRISDAIRNPILMLTIIIVLIREMVSTVAANLICAKHIRFLYIAVGKRREVLCVTWYDGQDVAICTCFAS